MQRTPPWIIRPATAGLLAGNVVENDFSHDAFHDSRLSVMTENEVALITLEPLDL